MCDVDVLPGTVVHTNEAAQVGRAEHTGEQGSVVLSGQFGLL